MSQTTQQLKNIEKERDAQRKDSSSSSSSSSGWLSWIRRDRFDRLVYAAYSGPHRYFRNGWGKDCARLGRQQVLKFVSASGKDIAPRIYWYGRRVLGRSGDVVIWNGAFYSPANELFAQDPTIEPLPPVVQTAHCRLVLPAHLEETFFKPNSASQCAVMISLASSGDQDYQWRTSRLAVPLARSHSLCSLMLMNAFYAKRRPEGQYEHFIDSVSLLMKMGICTILEGYSLLNYLYDLGHSSLGITGFSMGGSMACSVATLFHRCSIALVPCVPANSAADVYCDGVISSSIRWENLGDDQPMAKEKLRALLQDTTISTLEPPKANHTVAVIGALSDAFIATQSVERLSAYWGPSTNLIWFCGGHVTAFLVAPYLYRRTIAEAMENIHRDSHVHAQERSRHQSLRSAL